MKSSLPEGLPAVGMAVGHEDNLIRRDTPIAIGRAYEKTYNHME
jgi:hypothetical protein